MKLLICGSAASEAIPSMFCPCEVCNKAWERGGKEMRSRTAYQLGETIMIELGPDLLHHMFRYQLHLERLRHLFITHSHRDHLYSLSLGYRKKGFAQLDNPEPLNLYASRKVIDQIANELTPYSADWQNCYMEPHIIKPGSSVKLADENITFTAFAANHQNSEHEPMIFLAETPEKNILIGNDSGYFPDSTWSELKGFKIDIAILDCTMGKKDCRNGHMGVPVVLEVVERMRQENMLTAGSLVVANHFSHNGGLNHDDYENILNPHNVQVGYDGMEIDI